MPSGPQGPNSLSQGSTMLGVSSNPDTPEDLQPTAVSPPDPPRVLLHMPVDIRSMSLVVLTVLAILGVLRWASAFFIPLMVALVFSYALSPVVNWLARRKVPRSLSAAVLIVGILGGMGGAVYSLADDANALVTSLPQAARKLRDSLRHARAPTRSDSTIDSVQKAA